ncbi:hypothetical protein G6F46_005208 [Rhizopus delemar]|uniref:Phosphatidylcholine transfer protein n=3 Tax=Rhizopus TaxID=4842 RepID=I1BYB6_RHIO9|nr:hypothetical protein RO3G_05901 [Rhizopus delemar RA 99-880]KAG1047585.1 hypothetical protein G6F43_009973 [Rhizopus delemar]KAG1545635.1 hypothetical protein G6F51_005347 [Rhizopus arrhizus]KAG1457508.1 hypothetical protein G6F55_005892 [Rhizopus delemar]KAG1500280.1 hypothetical protein G6F54_003821 [Rhizopus delemar]|eukprot:EIE81196.1 hypothetical protein RO3G_05901 [Rhizopus delemar RA 99-880]
MPYFKKEAFCDYAKQFKNRNDISSEWEIYEKSSEFIVYRKPAYGRNDQLYQYKAIGKWSEIKPATLAQAYLDLTYRKKWDKNMQSYQHFECDGNEAIHFEIKYPWPLSNRDYTYVIEKQVLRDADGQIYIVILGESLPGKSFEGRKGVIRIDNYMQHICITPHEDGCLIYMDYFDDPKGNIPKSVINWAAKIAVPAFVNSLKNACLQYEKEHPGDVSFDILDVIHF